MDRATWKVFRQRDFGLLWWGGLVSLLGSHMLGVALPVTVLRLTGSPAAMALIVAAAVVPMLAVGPIAGVLVDRWDRRRVMIGANLAQAGAVLPLLLLRDAGDVWIAAAVMFASSAIRPFAATAENALLPTLVADGHLPAANSLNALNNNLARLIGPVVGGVLAMSAGLTGVVVVDAATFLFAAGTVRIVAAPVRAVATGAGASPVRRFLGELRDGLSGVTASPTLRTIVLILGGLSIGEGVMGSMFVVWVTQVLHGDAAEYGWVVAAQAVGGILGGLCGGWFGARWSPRLLFGAGLIVFGLIDLAIFTYPVLFAGIAPAVVGMIVVGVPAVLQGAAAMTLLQRASRDESRGRLFAAVGTLKAACMLLGTGLAVWLSGPLGIIGVLCIQGAIPVAAGTVALLALRTETNGGETEAGETTVEARPAVAAG